MSASTQQKSQPIARETEITMSQFEQDDIPLHSMSRKGISPTASANSTLPIARPRREMHSKFWRNSPVISGVIFISDLILTLMPCIFLILAFQALAANHYSVTSPHGQKVEEAAKLGPTFFPIIFAAVAGRFMRTYALWCAEKGAALGTLEQLNGSQNLLAALERAVLIPSVGFASIAIVVVWLLSPIGGQSSLRVLGRGQIAVDNQTTLYYFNNTAQGGGTAFQGASAYGDFSNGLNAVFQASLTSLERTKGSDTWGNIKIPVMEYISGQAGSDGWIPFDENRYNEPYSALNGLVISGLQDGLANDFTIESSYFNTTCEDPRYFNTSTGSPEEYGGFVQWGSPFVHRDDNTTYLFSSDSGSSVVYNSYMVDTNYNHTPHTDLNPIYNIIYASTYGGASEYDTIIAAYNCSIGMNYVESDILCNGKNCQVRRIRPSRKFGPNLSGYPWPTESFVPVSYLLQWMGTATSMTGSGDPSPIDCYISGSNTPFNLSQSVSYQNITAQQVGKRLQSLINTGWQLSYQGSSTAQSPPSNITALIISEDPDKADFVLGGVGFPVGTTMATTVTTIDVFIANRGWITATVVVSVVLLACGIGGLAFKYLSHSPDILGFVSSMTRDNPNFEHIPGSDRMDGLERARAMRHVRVQIVDIAPWGDGHITLRNIGHQSQSNDDKVVS